MKIYLAGPMRGLPEFNFPAFDQAAKALRDYGHDVFNPADRDRSTGFSTKGMTGNEDLATEGFDLREALAADTEYISKHADAVAVMRGWEKSGGARAEVALAHALGLPVAKWDDIIVSAGVGHARDIKESMLIKSDTKPSGTTIPKIGNVAFATGGFIPNGNDRETILDRVSRGTMTVDTARAKLGMAGPPAGEVRTTSSTGGEKGAKPQRYDLIPVGALAKVAELYGRGAAKYAAHNWRKGYEWSKSYAALQRHATQFWNGEDNDDEMGLPHMASVAFHALALLTFMEEQPGFDDRYRDN